MTITPEEVARLAAAATPGPWRVCETTIHGRKYGGRWVEGPEVDEGDGRIAGMLIPISGSGGSRSYTTKLVERQDHDHNDANAAFIAAAQDMAALIAELKAERDALVDRLESLTIAIGMGWDLDGVVSEARAAIAKIKEKNDE